MAVGAGEDAVGVGRREVLDGLPVRGVLGFEANTVYVWGGREGDWAWEDSFDGERDGEGSGGGLGDGLGGRQGVAGRLKLARKDSV